MNAPLQLHVELQASAEQIRTIGSRIWSSAQAQARGDQPPPALTICEVADQLDGMFDIADLLDVAAEKLRPVTQREREASSNLWRWFPAVCARVVARLGVMP